MKNKKNKFNEEMGKIEDTTKYGEFISSYFGWNTLEGQKEKVKDLENMTKNKKEKTEEKKNNKE